MGDWAWVGRAHPRLEGIMFPCRNRGVTSHCWGTEADVHGDAFALMPDGVAVVGGGSSSELGR